MPWQKLDEAAEDRSKAPWDGKPVLIYTDNRLPDERVNFAAWTNDAHGGDIYGWVVDDHKHGPYPLRGYNHVLAWQPAPKPPVMSRLR